MRISVFNFFSLAEPQNFEEKQTGDGQASAWNKST